MKLYDDVSEIFLLTPTIPSPSGSGYPASTTSKQPSASESKSLLFTIPSPSMSLLAPAVFS